ncbi:MAG TPA: hypothetical protein VMG12_27400, partial [Polyangiaceae bacterium]|nr:hypothetical protein [Polyangiaceae bacterium]
MNDRSIRHDSPRPRLRPGARRGSASVAAALLGTCVASTSHAGDRHSGEHSGEPRYAAGTTAYCVVDDSRGFDVAGGVSDGQRIVLVQAWYPTERRAAR